MDSSTDAGSSRAAAEAGFARDGTSQRLDRLVTMLELSFGQAEQVVPFRHLTVERKCLPHRIDGCG